MNYEIRALDASKNTSAILTGLTAARLREKVNGISILTVECGDKADWEHILPGKGFLRVLSSDGAAGSFRVLETSKKRDGERTSLAITCRGIIADTAAEIFAGARDCINYSPAELMEAVLSHSSYSVGVVDFTESIPYLRFDYEPVWNCLLRICSLTGGELSLDESTGVIALLGSIGADNSALFSYGLNLHGASRTVNTSRLSNRVYGVGGGNPPMTLSGATASSGKEYTDDSASQSLYGIFESVYNEHALDDVENLVSSPALDSSYTSGLCSGWSKIGAATLSKNTDPDYCLYGLVSQRVQSTADGQGISQAVTVSAGEIYSLSATLFISSGLVRVAVTDGSSTYRRTEAVTGNGMAVVRIEDWKANNSSVTVTISQEGSGSADFYVDSVQIASGAVAKAFTVGKSADALYTQTAEYLAAHKDPELSYHVDLAGLGEDNAMQFSLGDTVTVSDPTLDISVKTRVMEREADLLRPWRVNVKLDSATQGLADVISALRDAQEEGQRRMRTVLAERSETAENGSSRLGFSRQAFRFYGALSADSWDSLSWSAGTLKVGDAWYSIGAGSSTGLASATTYYFYFDRTTPTTFAYTSSETAAESDNRSHLFTAVTTSSPTKLSIYPLGIIHV